jgi:hypothetical protein
MGSEVEATQGWVILAGFENRHAAEQMPASLRRGFRCLRGLVDHILT